jgi:glycine/D-amino acid oxidase-like deaminating enzyme
MASIWKDTVQLPQFDTLEKNIHTDVLIIGGGIAGVLCAYYLKQAGIDCVLVEEKTICSGTTQNTTAKITSQHGLIYHKMVKQFGMEDARLYLQANQEALAEFRRLCSDIDCDFSEQDNYVYSAEDPDVLQQEMEALKALDFPAKFVTHLPIPAENVGAVCFPEQGQFHVLKFLSQIVKDLPIYEHTPVRELAVNIATCDDSTIVANKIIIATHFPMLNKHGSYFLKLYQHRAYCLALENVIPTDGMFVDENPKGLSFRSCGDLLILGGGGHRTGKKGGGWAELEAFARKHYPGARIRCRWATQDCMSLDGVPYIGRYSRNTDDLYAATG